MKVTTVLFLIGLVAVCSALNARTYRKYEKMYGQNKADMSFLELSKKQDAAPAAATFDVTSILQSLEKSKSSYPNKIQDQKKEYEQAYQRCMSSVNSFDCNLEEDWKKEIDNYGKSNQNISEQIKVNQASIESNKEKITKLEENYTAIFKDNDAKISKFERDINAIDTVLSYIKSVHVPSTGTILAQKNTQAPPKSALAELGSKIYDAADYITHPVGDMLLKFANIFLQSKQDAGTEAPAVAGTVTAGAQEVSKPTEKKLTDVMKKIQDLLLNLRGKILDQISERKSDIQKAQDFKQPLVDQSSKLVNELDILNKKLQSQANEQQKLVDEYGSNLKICSNIAVDKANCNDIRKAGEETLNDYQAISDLYAQSQDELAKLFSAATLGA